MRPGELPFVCFYDFFYDSGKFSCGDVKKGSAAKKEFIRGKSGHPRIC
jgi:hypothetical protein